MSLIHTCELSNVDPFDYLTQLQLNARQMSENPQNWLPWNYREALPENLPSAIQEPAAT
jgi:transposase